MKRGNTMNRSYTWIEMTYAIDTADNREYFHITVLSELNGVEVLHHYQYIHKEEVSKYEWEQTNEKFEALSKHPNAVKTWDGMVGNTTANFLTYEVRY